MNDESAILEATAHLQRAIEALEKAGHRPLVLTLVSAANALLTARRAA